jgi:HSP20 family molecular chaperone IbpA
VIRIETAGVGKAGLKAEVRGGLLVVTVTKQASRPVGALPSWAELATGVFERSFALPTGADPSKVVVARQLGILEFRFPLTPTPFSVVTPIPI